MADKKTRDSINKFIDAQTLLDTNLKLSDLNKRLGNDIGDIAGYTFAWDKYVYDIASAVLDDKSTPSLVAARTERRSRSVEILNTNIKVNELMKLTVETGIDEVAGYVYTEDKNTFIVASVASDLEKIQ